ncbi:zinc ribbon domain-containing protein [Salibacterium salarium]|uniref:Zinc ribbon domain-containing protein n=1 Tax=Salibacterium salarium TaxID=284579 RepID=A0A3R9PCD7_9BACI|nr:zinc ribbon domain-containing protein [Salibacterium salarium]RSL35379.1 zinc ribbon domain-containing protein [Salibacterium salarium]
MSDIQTKIGGGVNKLQDSIKSGKQKLQNAQEVSQHRRIVQEASEKRSMEIHKIGEIIYKRNRLEEETDSELHANIAKIKELDIIMYQAQQKIEEFQQQEVEGRVCPECHTSVSEVDKFCGSCGTEIPMPTPTDDKTKECHSCEQEIVATAAFCTCCGTKQS